MAEPTPFLEQNMVLKPAAGDEDHVSDLPAHYDDSGIFISSWKLSPEEIAEITRTGVVWLHVWGRHPPIAVTGFSPFSTEA